jgi:hypothetical protein
MAFFADIAYMANVMDVRRMGEEKGAHQPRSPQDRRAISVLLTPMKRDLLRSLTDSLPQAPWKPGQHRFPS